MTQPPDDYSREDLLRQIGELNAENLGLREKLIQSGSEAEWTVDRLKARTRLLSERVKELDCLYQVFQLVRNVELRPEQRIGRIVDLLPKAYQFPAVTRARAVIGGQEYRSNAFEATAWAQLEPIVVKGEAVGRLEVCCIKDLPAADEGPFLREERMLIRIVAECLGALCELETRKL